MNPRFFILLALPLLLAGAEATWMSKPLADHESVGRVLHAGISKLEAGALKPVDLLPALRNPRVLFTDDDGFRMRVQDLAFGMLHEARIPDLPRGSAPVFICGCRVDGEWHRFHVPHLTEAEFAQAIRTIESAKPGSPR